MKNFWKVKFKFKFRKCNNERNKKFYNVKNISYAQMHTKALNN